MLSAPAFVTALQQCAPSIGSLRSEGFSAEQAAALRQCYFCVGKRRRDPSELRTDAVLDLIENWDCSTVEIGMVRFAKQPRTIAGYVQVGFVESDSLVIGMDTTELLVLEEPGQKILWRCAYDQQAFLSALLVSARFLSAGPDLEDQKARRACATKATQLAGGKDYLSFFEMLLGCD